MKEKLSIKFCSKNCVKMFGSFSIFAIILISLFSCAAIEESTQYGFGKGPNSNKNKPVKYKSVQEYTALGEDTSFLRALNKAKIEAIRQGVIDIIGVYGEQSHQNELKKTIYNTDRPNSWIINSEMKVLQKSKTGALYVCKIRIPVKMDDLAEYLKREKIYADSDSAQGQNMQNNNAYVKPKKQDADEILAKAKEAAKDKDEVEFLNNYIENMTYMVFSSEKSSADRFLLKSGVEIANGWLLKQGYRAIDYSQVEKLKKDNARVYQESSDAGLSSIQFIAQKLNADVYIELDAETEGGYDTSGYYGSAKVTLKIFNPSTGELLGSVPYSSPKTFSKTSSYDAEANAIQSTVYKALPIAVDQAKILLAKAYSSGIRYELIINDTPDSKTLSRFRRQLKKSVSRVKTLYQSKSQTKYAVFFFGTIDDLEAMIYDVSERVPGFEDIELVMLRGKSITFKSGF